MHYLEMVAFRSIAHSQVRNDPVSLCLEVALQFSISMYYLHYWPRHLIQLICFDKLSARLFSLGLENSQIQPINMVTYSEAKNFHNHGHNFIQKPNSSEQFYTLRTKLGHSIFRALHRGVWYTNIQISKKWYTAVNHPIYNIQISKLQYTDTAFLLRQILCK